MRSRVLPTPRALVVALGAVLAAPAESSNAAAAPAAAAPRLKGPADVSFLLIPAGRFVMGCVSGDRSCDPAHPDYVEGPATRARESELPGHPVRLGAFYLAETETTNAQYSVCVAAGACRPPAGALAEPDPETLQHPAVGLSWGDASGFCEWIGGRLPTEAEWEYAARGGAGPKLYPTGASLARDQANYGAGECCSGRAEGRDRWRRTAPVRSFPAGSHGLYDMAGNVWEYVADWYSDAYYAWSPGTDPAGPAAGERRAMRGGSWLTTPDALRSSSRGSIEPTARDESGDQGFRCARDPVSVAAALGDPDGRRDPFRPPTCVLAALAQAARSAAPTLDLAKLAATCNQAKGLRTEFLLDAELDLRNVLFQAPEANSPFRRSLVGTLAEIQIERGEYLAAAEYRRLLFEGSSSRSDRADLATAHLLIADRAAERGDPAAARRQYRAAIEHLEALGERRRLARAYTSLAVTCAAIYGAEEERELLARAAELDAGCGECRDNLARFLIEQGARIAAAEADRARSYFEEALEREPSPALRAVARYRLGLTLWEDESRARAYLDEAGIFVPSETVERAAMKKLRWSWKALEWTPERGIDSIQQ